MGRCPEGEQHKTEPKGYVNPSSDRNKPEGRDSKLHHSVVVDDFRIEVDANLSEVETNQDFDEAYE